MRFDEGAELETSQVDDLRGGGSGIGGWVGMGGGVSVVGLLLFRHR